MFKRWEVGGRFKALHLVQAVLQARCVPLHACMLSHSSSVQLCDSMDCSPPGSSVHGILQARILEWVAISSSRGSSLPRDWTCMKADSFLLEPPGKPLVLGVLWLGEGQAAGSKLKTSLWNWDSKLPRGDRRLSCLTWRLSWNYGSFIQNGSLHNYLIIYNG